MNSETCLLLFALSARPFLLRIDRFQSYAKENLTPERVQKNRAAEGEPSTLHGLQSNQQRANLQRWQVSVGCLIPGWLLLSRATCA
jgi:hypothetical protein